MNPTPAGWSRISATLYYDDAKAAIAWLCKAFGFEVRLVVETDKGAVTHSELVIGEGVIMIAQSGERPHAKSPRQADGCTQGLMVYVDDVEAHFQRARAAGATLTSELAVSDHGADYWTDRSYGALDCGGHPWWFCERIRTGDPNWGDVRNKVERSKRA